MKSVTLLFASMLVLAACSSNTTSETSSDSTAVDTAAVAEPTPTPVADTTTAKIPVEEVK
jgi:uncharacterized protein YcfL